MPKLKMTAENAEWKRVNKLIQKAMIDCNIGTNSELGKIAGISGRVVGTRFGMNSPWKITELTRIKQRLNITEQIL